MYWVCGFCYHSSTSEVGYIYKVLIISGTLKSFEELLSSEIGPVKYYKILENASQILSAKFVPGIN